ncbi:hypothetical protein [Aminobacter sp. AP02]|uniref:hypothetical protein n=1 Tax=Aminobacter sp. AP02 TaxID=2135737 RepID=UPI000D6D246D|nr:hypothetical protein [Aminobacter sp. AP02]PWK76164.1 hypothetical protein C8K44_102151 [Aminobacter sp. AP02]
MNKLASCSSLILSLSKDGRTVSIVKEVGANVDLHPGNRSKAEAGKAGMDCLYALLRSVTLSP